MKTKTPTSKQEKVETPAFEAKSHNRAFLARALRQKDRMLAAPTESKAGRKADEAADNA